MAEAITVAARLAVLGNEAARRQMEQFRAQVKDIGKSSQENLSRFSDKLRGVSSELRTAGLAMTAFAAAGAFVGKQLIDAASDAEEMRNKFRETFGVATPAAQKALIEFADTVGRGRVELQSMAADVGAVVKSAGLMEDEAARLSVDLTKLATDVASFTNANDAMVLQAFTRALTGEREALKTYGISITQAEVEARAFAMGIEEVGAEMSATDKALVTYQLLLDKTSDSQGDALRTAGSYANMSRRLGGALSDLKVTMGEVLLPVATKVITAFADLATKLRDMNPTVLKAVVVVGALATGFAALAGPILLFLGFLPQIITGLALVRAAFIATTGVMTGPVGMAIAIGVLVAALAPTLINALSGATDAQYKFNKSVGEGVQPVNDLAGALRQLDFTPFTELPQFDAFGIAQFQVDLQGLQREFGATDAEMQTLLSAMGEIRGPEDLERALADIRFELNLLHPAIQEIAAGIEGMSDLEAEWAEILKTSNERMKARIRFSVEAKTADDEARKAREALITQELAEKLAVDDLVDSIGGYVGVLDRAIPLLRGARLIQAQFAAGSISAAKASEALSLIIASLVKELNAEAAAQARVTAALAERIRMQERLTGQALVGPGAGGLPPVEGIVRVAFEGLMANALASGEFQQLLDDLGNVIGFQRQIFQNGQLVGAERFTFDEFFRAVLANFEQGNTAADAMIAVLRQLQSLLGFEHGGVVPGPIGRPQLAMVHGGETIIPAGRGGGGVTVNLDLRGAVIGVDDLRGLILRTVRDQRGAGGFAGVFR